jgi:nickel-type superoxide dismutase maturation protease
MGWLYVRRIVGHSMLPKFIPGELVIGMRRRHRRPKAGKVVIIQHEGKEKIKRIAKVDAYQVYVLGDNLAASTDSRHYGWIDMSDVVATIIWPRAHGRTQS